MLDFLFSAEDAERALDNDVARNSFLNIVRKMSDAELVALEDELDFFQFAGVPSHKILAIMEEAGVLDAASGRILHSQIALDLPEVR